MDISPIKARSSGTSFALDSTEVADITNTFATDAVLQAFFRDTGGVWEYLKSGQSTDSERYDESLRKVVEALFKIEKKVEVSETTIEKTLTQIKDLFRSIYVSS